LPHQPDGRVRDLLAATCPKKNAVTQWLKVFVLAHGQTLAFPIAGQTLPIADCRFALFLVSCRDDQLEIGNRKSAMFLNFLDDFGVQKAEYLMQFWLRVSPSFNRSFDWYTIEFRLQ
jgi:hypothetical protein